MNKKNILFLTNSLDYAGASKMICFVAESLSNRGHCITIANYKSATDSSGFERTLDPKIKRVDVLVPKGKNRHSFRIKETHKLAKEISADVIIAFTAFPNVYAKLVASMLHIPSIMSERGDPSQTVGKSIKDRMMMWLINSSRGGVFQTQGAMTFFGNGLQKRGIVIPNPIFINGEIPQVEYSDREKTVVSVGRLDNFQKTKLPY